MLDALVTGPGRVAPGATAFAADGDGAWSGSAGIADVRTHAALRPDARMRLESVSKAWTATLVLRLVEQGRLGLDDTVARTYPGLLPFEDITIRQLLNHTSGLFDSSDAGRLTTAAVVGKIEDPAERARIRAVAERVERDPEHEFAPALWVRVAAAQPLAFPPGTGFHYSNIGYEALGLVAQRLAGVPLARLYEREITRPLGLASASYEPHRRIRGPHARGYRVASDGTLTDTTGQTLGVGAAGGIAANAADTARFLRALMAGEVLEQPQLRAMKQVEPAAAPARYGLGIGVVSTSCGLAFGHNGGGPGYTTSAVVAADGRRVAVVLANGRTADGHGDRAVSAAARRLFCAA